MENQHSFIKHTVITILPLAIRCKLAGSSGLNMCFKPGESLINLVCSGVQLVSCFSTGISSDFGRNQKGTADMRVMAPAMR